jgi:multiple sugar transport system substrate-binding protein
MSSPQGQASWARDTYATPSSLEAINDPVLMADPNWQFIVNAMDISSTSEFVTGYPNYMEQINQRQESIFRGDIPVEQALEEAQAAVDQTIADNS